MGGKKHAKRGKTSESTNKLLPKNAEEFANPKFWEKFNEETREFEWYGSYKELSGTIEKYIKPSYKYLQIGCGNSNLASDMYDAGCHNITSIDIDERSIKQQIKKNAKRPELVFKQGSVESIAEENASFDIVFDKGTLDALLPKDGKKNSALVQAYFDEAFRVLKVDGLFMIVTLAQDQILEFVTSYVEKRASTQGCLLRIEKVDNSEDARLKKSISFPVYIVVITKLSKPIDTAESFIEVVPSKMVSPPVQCKGAIDIKAIMSQDRELQYFVAICATQKLSTEHLLQLHSGITGNLRFEIIVVDDLDVEVPKTYAVFIVPADRNNEYLFDCIEGRMALLKDLQYDRLTIIRLQDEEYYESLDSVKNELNALAFCLRPRACEDDHVQMLSIGPTFTKKMIVAKGEGINGPWEVLHVQQANGECFRQLVFTRVANLVQSEARIIENFDNPEETVIDTKTLTCSYQQTMLGSILFLELFRNQSDEQLEANLCVLGLGGGSLTTFLHDTFPKSTITAVDIDKETFDIAKQYFGLPNNSPRVDVILEDAMVFLEEVSAGQRVKKPFDVVFLDISGDHHVDGLVCPTPEFAIRMVFQLVKECMAPNGVLAVNVVSRNMTSRQNVMREFQGVFESSFMFSHDTDLNVVLFGTDQPEAKKTLTINGISHLADSKWIKVKPHGVTSFPKDL